MSLNVVAPDRVMDGDHAVGVRQLTSFFRSPSFSGQLASSTLLHARCGRFLGREVFSLLGHGGIQRAEPFPVPAPGPAGSARTETPDMTRPAAAVKLPVRVIHINGGN